MTLGEMKKPRYVIAAAFLVMVTVGTVADIFYGFRPVIENARAQAMERRPSATPPAVKTLQDLYAELQQFKDDPEFRRVGYGRCCKYFQWMQRVEALQGQASPKEFMDGFGILPRELVQLGWEYFGGHEESAQYWEKQIAGARNPVSSLPKVDRAEEDGLIGSWTTTSLFRGKRTDFVMHREDGQIILTSSYHDGSSRKQVLDEIEPQAGQLRRFRERDGEWNETMVILKDGGLGMYDTDGLIFRADRQ